MEWIKNDVLFKRELNEGYRQQMEVGKAFLEANFPTYVPPLQVRKSIDEIDQYTDQVDLMIQVGQEWFPIEVKSRRLEFTDAHDYPFDTAFVDTKKGWDAKKQKPLAVIVVSQITGSAVVIKNDTAPTWTTKLRQDRVRDILEEFYEVDRRMLLAFIDFIAELRLKERGAL